MADTKSLEQSAATLAQQKAMRDGARREEQEFREQEQVTGDRKGALEALRRARDKSNDIPAFSAWLNQEPAFAKLLEGPQFRALLANP